MLHLIIALLSPFFYQHLKSFLLLSFQKPFANISKIIYHHLKSLLSKSLNDAGPQSFCDPGWLHYCLILSDCVFYHPGWLWFNYSQMSLHSCISLYYQCFDGRFIIINAINNTRLYARLYWDKNQTLSQSFFNKQVQNLIIYWKLISIAENTWKCADDSVFTQTIIRAANN